MVRIFTSLLILTLIGCQSQPLPENWAPLTTVVERPDFLSSKGVVTTISPNLFTSDLDWFNEQYPEGSVRHEALRRHERQHALEQEEWVGGVTGWRRSAKLATWVKKYLADRQFRWEVEKRGYRESILHFRNNGYTINVEGYAKTLSGSSYNDMVSYEEALEWVKAVLRGGA